MLKEFVRTPSRPPPLPPPVVFQRSHGLPLFDLNCLGGGVSSRGGFSFVLFMLKYSCVCLDGGFFVVAVLRERSFSFCLLSVTRNAKWE